MTMSPLVADATIVALSSGVGRAGVAVLRVSGPRARFVAEMIAGSCPQPRHGALRRIVDPASGDVLDHGLVLFFPGPQSFTGEDVVEFQIHGSTAVVRAVIRAIQSLDPTIRMAEPGEFSRRAFLNGKMDLAAIEGLADLIDSETEWQRKQALRQMEGQLGGLTTVWREALVRTMAMVEAELDFSDEGDVPADVSHDLRCDLSVIHLQMRDILRHAGQGERIREGYRVVIAGAPNVGKSSLLNALARREAALVSPVAGTTRDIIEVRCDIRGYPVLLLDTAGLHNSDDEVERLGMDRARANIVRADIILLLAPDPQDEVSALLGTGITRTITIATKADLGPVEFAHDIAVSARTGEGLDTLLTRIGDILETISGGETSLIANERQRQALSGASDALERIAADESLAGELVAEELRYAVRKLDYLIGRVDHEHVLDQVFSRFCIGK
jgi:tRNA modification GTPase